MEILNLVVIPLVVIVCFAVCLNAVNRVCNSVDLNTQTKLQLRQIDSYIVQHMEFERVVAYAKIQDYQNRSNPLVHIQDVEVSLLPKTK